MFFYERLSVAAFRFHGFRDDRYTHCHLENQEIKSQTAVLLGSTFGKPATVSILRLNACGIRPSRFTRRFNFLSLYEQIQLNS